MHTYFILTNDDQISGYPVR